jgi:hypothetical protein
MRRIARQLYPDLTPTQWITLKRLVVQFGLSLENGHLVLIGGSWYVTNSGLLDLACRRRCKSIKTQINSQLSNPTTRFWIVNAAVRTEQGGEFTGCGDADPSNISELMRGAELRIAETRAVNRALRKAYGIGLCSSEEIGASPIPVSTDAMNAERKKPLLSLNGHQHTVRDRLCQLIRRHKLDPELVKRYAADFCGTQSLREASRESITDFVEALARQAQEDLEALICKLNGYAQQQEVAS